MTKAEAEFQASSWRGGQTMRTPVLWGEDGVTYGLEDGWAGGGDVIQALDTGYVVKTGEHSKWAVS